MMDGRGEGAPRVGGRGQEGKSRGQRSQLRRVGNGLIYDDRTYALDLIMHHAIYVTRVDSSILPQSILLIAARGVYMSRGLATDPHRFLKTNPPPRAYKHSQYIRYYTRA